jgi:hypothetical protein
VLMCCAALDTRVRVLSLASTDCVAHFLICCARSTLFYFFYTLYTGACSYFSRLNEESGTEANAVVKNCNLVEKLAKSHCSH